MDGKDKDLTKISQEILHHWDDFTVEEVDWIAGDPRKLQEALVQKFGVSQDEAARQVFEFWSKHFENNSDSQSGDSAHLGLVVLLSVAMSGVWLASTSVVHAEAARKDVTEQSQQMSQERFWSDENITTAVSDRLKRAFATDAMHIDVSCDDGVVTLSGTTDNMLTSRESVEIAEHLRGVKSVINLIEVDSPSVSDEELHRRVQKAIYINPDLQLPNIQVNVRGGVVTLLGKVDSYPEKTFAEELCLGVEGVSEIQNNITTDNKGRRSDREVERDVRLALESSVWVDAEGIDISANDGTVSLSGEVGSAAERSKAYSLAWVAGAKDVVHSKLKVNPDLFEEREKNLALNNPTSGEIKKAIRKTLQEDPRIMSADIELDVHNDRVTLAGEVPTLKAFRAAEEDTLNTYGVVFVKNLLLVTPTEPVADTALKESVNLALIDDPIVNVSTIRVSVADGIVQLRGQVESYFDKLRAEEAIANLSGVRAIQNELVIDTDWTVADDMSLKDQIQDELRWSPFVKSGNISVSVDQGTATLSGDVAHWFARQEAIERARHAGAQRVIDQLEVR